ncbi:hypothetical protein AALO_G00148690 [Alosa alosa]|uniref:Uncharacterized protein n=1 Tax=Alosa alosa TaxID=278164 RepID=A0AAV6GDS5_9TELE|nr:hypothetical protein AALO_G00148690 [Alosa alosa]
MLHIKAQAKLSSTYVLGLGVEPNRLPEAGSESPTRGSLVCRQKMLRGGDVTGVGEHFKDTRPGRGPLVYL